MPLPAIGHVFSGFEFLGVILVTAIPFGIYDLVEAMDNVESAEAAGDHYPTTRVLTADGVVSLIGCLMGNPFINAVYIGHPGWKAMGGRIGYSAATGLMVIVLSWFGVISLMLALIPVVAISPILLYIGMLIGAQAFQDDAAAEHAPAIVLALTPHLAAWAKVQIDDALGAAGMRSGGHAPEFVDKMAQNGRAVSRPRSDGRRLDPDRPRARRDRRLHHRPQVRQGRGIRGAPARCSPSSASCTARRSASAAASASRRGWPSPTRWWRPSSMAAAAWPRPRPVPPRPPRSRFRMAFRPSKAARDPSVGLLPLEAGARCAGFFCPDVDPGCLRRAKPID